jgi:hypothetical protein
VETFKRLALLKHKQVEELKSSVKAILISLLTPAKSDPTQVHQKDVEQWKTKANELMRAAAAMKGKITNTKTKTKSENRAIASQNEISRK